MLLVPVFEAAIYEGYERRSLFMGPKSLPICLYAGQQTIAKNQK